MAVEQERGHDEPAHTSDAAALGALRDRVAKLEARLERADATIEQLRDDQRFFERLNEAVPAGLAYLDDRLIYRYCNATNAAFLGRPLAQILGQHLRTVVPENPTLWQTIELVVATGEPYPLQELSIVFAGREREGVHHFLIAFLPDRDASGHVRGVFLIAHDISELVRTREALRFLTDASSALATSLDIDTTLATIVELAVPRLSDMCLLDIVVSGETRVLAAAHDDPRTQALLYEIRERYPFELTGPDANIAWLDRLTGEGPIIQAAPVEAMLPLYARDDAHAELLQQLRTSATMFVPLLARDRLVGVLSLAMGRSGRGFELADLTLAEELARRAALAIDNALLFEQVQTAEASYRGLFDGAADAIIVTAANGQHIEANEAAVELTGYSREELFAMRIGSGALMAEGPEWTQIDAEQLSQNSSWRGEWELRRKDGSSVPVESVVQRVTLPSGSVSIGMLRDISERRQIELMQREFMAMVTHELKGPLTAIRGFSQLMRRQSTYNERGVDAILNQSAQLERLINDMLDATRVDAGQLDLRRADTDLCELVVACAEQAQTATTRHLIRSSVTATPIVGQWDRDRLAQVFGNLLSNAIKYDPDGGDISIAVSDDGDSARVSVQDAGIGIPEEAIPRLFDRFFRVGDTTLASAKGLGLGLFITRSLVEAHGGTIEVSSTPGVGSTFTVLLPKGN